MRGKSRTVLAVVVLFAAFILAAPVAHAGAILVGNANWYEFGFPASGFAVSGSGTAPSSGGNSIFADAPPWTWTSTGNTLLTVVDAFLSVDQFQIYDFGTAIAPTSINVVGSSGISDPVFALLDLNYSRGFFNFGAGNHSLTMENIAATGQPGAGFFRVDAVPEPGTLMLLGSGLVGLVGYRRRKRMM